MGDEGAIGPASKALKEFIGLLSREDAARLSELIRSSAFERPSEGALNALRLPPGAARRVTQSLSRLHGDEALIALAAMLSYHSQLPDGEPLEVCCTGEGLEKVARSTWPVLEDLLSGAKDEILIVGFDIRPSFRPIFELIELKASEGTDITIMVDAIERKTDLIEWLTKMPSNVAIYHRPKRPGKDYSKLHMKCIMVDNRACLIGSTNLTFLGLKRNIEMNIVVRDKDTLKRIRAIIDEVEQGLSTYEIPIR